jgi:cysteinyl-tRNA synthetase
MDADLNAAAALGHLFDLVREANTALDAGAAGSADGAAVREVLARFESIFGLRLGPGRSLEAAIEDLIARRQAARVARDWKEDTPHGVRWKRRGA